MNTISICESEKYYFNKNKKSNKFTDNKKFTDINKFDDIKEFTDKKINMYKNVYIKKNNKFKGKKKNISVSKNCCRKYVKQINEYKENNKFKPFQYEEYQIDFELSLDEIEKSFDDYSLDLLKYDQLRDVESIKHDCEEYKPILYEEEQLEFELSLEDIESSFDKMSLDLLQYNQLDDDINNINADMQAYENKVELEFEYSDED